jgi:hypothetical protein
MSATPRTDAEQYPEAEGRDFNVVAADFARTLERELADAQKRIAECNMLLEFRQSIIERQEPRCAEAKRREDVARAEIARLNGQTRWQCDCGGTDCAGQKENEVLREKVRVLREACQSAVREYSVSALNDALDATEKKP